MYWLFVVVVIVVVVQVWLGAVCSFRALKRSAGRLLTLKEGGFRVLFYGARV